MLLTPHVDDFRRLPKISLLESMGFRGQCKYLLQHGFALHCSPFSEEYKTSPVTRGFGRVTEVSIPIDAGNALMSGDYVVAKSRCETMLILYWHKAKNDVYCEIVQSSYAGYISLLFDYYRVCFSNDIYKDYVDVGGNAS